MQDLKNYSQIPALIFLGMALKRKFTENTTKEDIWHRNRKTQNCKESFLERHRTDTYDILAPKFLL